MTDASFGSASIQGPLHIATPLGRKKKVRKAEPKTLYVNRPVLNAEDIIAWAKANGFGKTVQPDDMHVTCAFSRALLEWPEQDTEGWVISDPKNPTIARFGPGGDCVVLTFENDFLKARWQQFNDAGASWDWPDYCPHITLSYNGFNQNDLHPIEIEPYDGPIILGPEEFAELNEDWKASVIEKGNDMDLVEAERLQKLGARNSRKDLGMIQTMHDHAVTLGARCNGLVGYDQDVDKVARIAKIDESLGLVFGYAIVCKVNGQPYYDLNVDKGSDGTMKRVPEHIPEESMLKAAVNFMQQTERAGNEMHDGPDVGTYVFAFPMTTEIAKAFGIQTNTTGLMIAYKPTPEVFAKFKSGEYTGFSIEGSRVKSQEIE